MINRYQRFVRKCCLLLQGNMKQSNIAFFLQVCCVIVKMKAVYSTETSPPIHQITSRLHVHDLAVMELSCCLTSTMAAPKKIVNHKNLAIIIHFCFSASIIKNFIRRINLMFYLKYPFCHPLFASWALRTGESISHPLP
jgi:hypothetical protein